MKRVLMVSCGGLGNGGVQAIIMGIVRKLSDQCIFDALLFTSEKRFYDDEFISYGGKIHRIPHYEGGSSVLREAESYLRDYCIYRKCVKIFRIEKYDIIHCHKEFESAPILKAAKEAGIPLRICHSHVINPKCNPLLSAINKIRQGIIIRNSHYLIGCSDESCKSLFGQMAYYRIINNFYDDKRFTAEVKLKELKQCCITQVGAISRIKNQAFSIRIFEELQKNGLNATLNIIGFDLDADYKTELIELIKNKGLLDKVKFLPGNCNTPSILKESTVFIMPSLHEGFGIALIEAQAMHLRCFASTGIPTSVDCGGVTFLPLDKGPEYWASQIKQTIREKPRLVNTEKYKLSVVVNSYKKLYSII